MIKSARRISLLAAVVAGIVLIATPASAHTITKEIYSGIPSYRRGFVEVSGTQHSAIAACDTRADGVGFRAEFYYRYPGVVDDRYGTISDANGSSTGCGRFTTPSYGYITLFRGWWGSKSTGWVTVT